MDLEEALSKAEDKYCEADFGGVLADIEGGAYYCRKSRWEFCVGKVKILKSRGE